MLLQDILAASGNGAGQRSSERFSLSVFGTPAETGAWGLRCEGHHLTQSVAVRDNRIVSVTPTSFSAHSQPGEVRPAHRPQHAEGRGGRGAAADGRSYAEAARPRAHRRFDALQHSLLRRPRAFQRQEGRPAGRRSCRRRSAICSGRWSSSIRSSISRRSFPTRSGRACSPATGRRCISPGTGRNTPEKAFGYRVIGDGFVIEMASVDAEAQHLHTIYHDLANVLGRASRRWVNREAACPRCRSKRGPALRALLTPSETDRASASPTARARSRGRCGPSARCRSAHG